jgi:HrpA-like RNA helicase
MQYSRPWLTRRDFADSAEPLSISPTNQNNDRNHIDLVLSEELLSTMSQAADTVLRGPIQDRKRRARDDGRRKFSKLPSFSDSLGSKTRSQLLLKRHNEYKTNPRLKKMRDERARLPMNQYRTAILDLTNSNPYSIIVGATGSGKSTQVPQIILEDAIERGHGADVNILCTQPRRIAATSLARRVSSERNEDVGDTVGYVIRFDNKLPQSSGTITYCTIGALLARLRTEHADLNSISHIILDEVHERSVENDFLMVALKKLLENRTKAGKKVPRLVISKFVGIPYCHPLPY